MKYSIERPDRIYVKGYGFATWVDMQIKLLKI